VVGRGTQALLGALGYGARAAVVGGAGNRGDTCPRLGGSGGCPLDGGGADPQRSSGGSDSCPRLGGSDGCPLGGGDAGLQHSGGGVSGLFHGDACPHDGGTCPRVDVGGAGPHHGLGLAAGARVVGDWGERGHK
jgi:hypothetical protein